MSTDNSNTPSRERNFLNRWSTRKREGSAKDRRVKTEDAPELDSAMNLDSLNSGLNSEPASAAPLTTIDDANSEAQPLESSEALESIDAQEPLLTDADMPALETLDAKSDLSDFFNKGVSATLRRAALRHVFSLPVYNVRDGLNDYDDDYTKFEPLGDTVTSDMKWHKERKEREAAEAEEERKRLAEEAEAESNAEEDAKELEAQQENDEADQLEDDDASANEDTEQELMDSDESPEAIDGLEENDRENNDIDPIHATTKQTETSA